jgi:hypothetical protein
MAQRQAAARQAEAETDMAARHEMGMDDAGDETGLCAFCQKACGRNLKRCAEENGGRKAVKALLRSMDNDDDADEERSERLFELYKSVSSRLYIRGALTCQVQHCGIGPQLILQWPK